VSSSTTRPRVNSWPSNRPPLKYGRKSRWRCWSSGYGNSKSLLILAYSPTLQLKSGRRCEHVPRPGGCKPGQVLLSSDSAGLAGCNPGSLKARRCHRSLQCPFVASNLSRTHRKKQALCRGSIGANAFLKMTN